MRVDHQRTERPLGVSPSDIKGAAYFRHVGTGEVRFVSTLLSAPVAEAGWSLIEIKPLLNIRKRKIYYPRNEV
jgi:hypothetical protein